MGADVADRSTRRAHWQRVHRTKDPRAVKWYQSRPSLSLDLIAAHTKNRSAALIDVGGGTSNLVDHLIAAGYGDLSVLDLSAAALDIARRRLGPAGAAVTWIEADLIHWQPPRTFDLWHDRAVFHFLSEAADRAGYRRALATALPVGGHAILATFAPDGPEKCSGLPVARYGPADMAAEMAPDFELRESRAETHRTPGGEGQYFTYFILRRV